MILLLFRSKYFIISFVISSLIYELFGSMLLNFQVFRHFLNILIIISNLIPLWSENIFWDDLNPFKYIGTCLMAWNGYCSLGTYTSINSNNVILAGQIVYIIFFFLVYEFSQLLTKKYLNIQLCLWIHFFLPSSYLFYKLYINANP